MRKMHHNLHVKTISIRELHVENARRAARTRATSFGTNTTSFKARIESRSGRAMPRSSPCSNSWTTARDERKQRLEKRLAEVRADYRERSDKLHQAWGADEVRAPLRVRRAGSLHAPTAAVRGLCSTDSARDTLPGGV